MRQLSMVSSVLALRNLNLVKTHFNLTKYKHALICPVPKVNSLTMQSRTQSNACARGRMALALGKLTTGTPKFRGSGFVGMHVKPISAQEKFNLPRANAILARAQALLWVRDC